MSQKILTLIDALNKEDLKNSVSPARLAGIYSALLALVVDKYTELSDDIAKIILALGSDNVEDKNPGDLILGDIRKEIGEWDARFDGVVDQIAQLENEIPKLQSSDSVKVVKADGKTSMQLDKHAVDAIKEDTLLKVEADFCSKEMLEDRSETLRTGITEKTGSTLSEAKRYTETQVDLFYAKALDKVDPIEQKQADMSPLLLSPQEWLPATTEPDYRVPVYFDFSTTLGITKEADEFMFCPPFFTLSPRIAPEAYEKIRNWVALNAENEYVSDIQILGSPLPGTSIRSRVNLRPFSFREASGVLEFQFAPIYERGWRTWILPRLYTDIKEEMFAFEFLPETIDFQMLALLADTGAISLKVESNEDMKDSAQFAVIPPELEISFPDNIHIERMLTEAHFFRIEGHDRFTAEPSVTAVMDKRVYSRNTNALKQIISNPVILNGEPCWHLFISILHSGGDTIVKYHWSQI